MLEKSGWKNDEFPPSKNAQRYAISNYTVFDSNSFDTLHLRMR
jgi:hypothetical protein